MHSDQNNNDTGNTPDLQINVVVSGDIKSAAQKLINAAIEYSLEFDKIYGRGSAVKWVKSDEGKLVIFTEGQHLQTLMRNIDTVHREVYFTENDL